MLWTSVPESRPESMLLVSMPDSVLALLLLESTPESVSDRVKGAGFVRLRAATRLEPNATDAKMEGGTHFVLLPIVLPAIAVLVGAGVRELVEAGVDEWASLTVWGAASW